MGTKGIPSPFGFGGGQLPPELAAKVDAIARAIQPSLQELAQIVHENNLNCFDMMGGIHGIEVHLGVHNPNAPHPEFDEMDGGFDLLETLGIRKPKSRIRAMAGVPGFAPPNMPPAPKSVAGDASAPPPDLLEGIESLLRRIYKEEDSNILGMIYSPHKSAAIEIAKILDAARKRDQKEFAAELQKLVDRFRT